MQDGWPALYCEHGGWPPFVMTEFTYCWYWAAAIAWQFATGVMLDM
jgi:hypothetical protein